MTLVLIIVESKINQSINKKQKDKSLKRHAIDQLLDNSKKLIRSR